MKNTFIIILLCSCFAVYSQNDSISNAKKSNENKYGVSLFAGLGVGGNDMGHTPMLKGGYAKTINARFHKGMHTFNIQASQVTSMDQAIFNKLSPSTELNMRNIGLTYGVGSYGENFSAGFLFGVSYTSISIPYENSFMLDIPSYVYYKQKYNVVNACFGLHASVKRKRFGIGYQIYYNLFGPIASFNSTIGVEVGLNKKP